MTSIKWNTIGLVKSGDMKGYYVKAYRILTELVVIIFSSQKISAIPNPRDTMNGIRI